MWAGVWVCSKLVLSVMKTGILTILSTPQLALRPLGHWTSVHYIEDYEIHVSCCMFTQLVAGGGGLQSGCSPPVLGTTCTDPPPALTLPGLGNCCALGAALLRIGIHSVQ